MPKFIVKYSEQLRETDFHHDRIADHRITVNDHSFRFIVQCKTDDKKGRVGFVLIQKQVQEQRKAAKKIRYMA